jgi:hypothetical protein
MKGRGELFGVASHLAEGDGELVGEVLDVALDLPPEGREGILSQLASRIGIGDRERLERALAGVRQIGDAGKLASALVELASAVDESGRERMVPRILEAARPVEAAERAELLTGLVERLSGDARAQVLQEAVAAAELVEGPFQRPSCWSALAPYVERKDEALRKALDAVRAIEDEPTRARALVAVAAKLEGSGREVLQIALQLTCEIGDERDRAEVLGAVAAHLGAHEELWEGAAKAARQIEHGLLRAYALRAIAASNEKRGGELAQEALAAAEAVRDDKYRVLALCHATFWFQGREKEEILKKAWDAARKVAGARDRATALVEVAELLEEEKRDGVLREALEAGEAIEEEGNRVEFWSGIASYLKGEAREALLRRALATAGHIDEDNDPAFELGEVVEAMEKGDRQLLGEAWETARRLRGTDSRARALSMVAQKLNGEELQRRSRDVRPVMDAEDALDYLRAVGRHWQEYRQAAGKPAAEELESWLGPLSREARPHLLGAIGALAPAIADAGGAAAVGETVEAICDVGRWWA